MSKVEIGCSYLFFCRSYKSRGNKNHTEFPFNLSVSIHTINVREGASSTCAVRVNNLNQYPDCESDLRRRLWPLPRTL